MFWPDNQGLARTCTLVTRIAAIRIVRALLPLAYFRANSTRRATAGAAQMLVVKGTYSFAVSLALIAAVTAILWQVNLTTGGSHRLVYFYLFPVALIAALYNGRLAMLSTAMAMACADYFLQEPLYSFANDNPLEYSDLIWFAVLAAAGIKFIRVWCGPAQKPLM